MSLRSSSAKPALDAITKYSFTVNHVLREAPMSVFTKNPFTKYVCYLFHVLRTDESTITSAPGSLVKVRAGRIGMLIWLILPVRLGDLRGCEDLGVHPFEDVGVALWGYCSAAVVCRNYIAFALLL